MSEDEFYEIMRPFLGPDGVDAAKLGIDKPKVDLAGSMALIEVLKGDWPKDVLHRAAWLLPRKQRNADICGALCGLLRAPSEQSIPKFGPVTELFLINSAMESATKANCDDLIGVMLDRSVSGQRMLFLGTVYKFDAARAIETAQEVASWMGSYEAKAVDQFLKRRRISLTQN